MYIPSRGKILESIQVISTRLSIIDDALKQPISQERRALALTTKEELTAKLSRLEADLVHSEMAEVAKKSARTPLQVPDTAKVESISEHLSPVPYSEWFKERRVLLSEALEDRKGIVSLPATTFESKTIFPEDFAIKGTLKKERTPWELVEIAKAERRAEEARIIEEAKRLYTKVGGRLEDDDFWEPYIREGEVHYKPAFFRTKEGGIAYAGDNPKIILESRLSQATTETSLAEVSIYDSEKIKVRIAERAKAYDKEQYDSDTILSNRGLPVKDADKLRRETEQFERDFVINFMINHPDQMKPWLEAADPKTIKYLNNILGGEEILRRKWLPQIEFQGRLFEIGKKRDLGGDTLTDIGVSLTKIKKVVEGASSDKSKNTVIYLVGRDIPKDPQEYAAFVEKLRIGKENYITKLGKEIDEQVQKKPETGLGMSVSTGILDLLNPKDVPKGIQISSPVAKADNIQVVKYVPPLRSIAEYRPLHKAWKEGMEAITRQTEAIRTKYPNAIQGRIIRIKDAPVRFGAAQEGVVLTDDGREIQFVTYKKDNPPVLAKNQRYTLKNPAETIEGSGTIARVTRDNIEEANFPSQQVSTRGIVLDVFDINDPKGTAQYGHLISPVDGKIIKFTTFSRDNPPALEKGRMYTIYNSFLQGFQTGAGKFELNINIKPENLYPEKTALTQEQKSLIENVRASTYRTVIHPTDYKPFEGLPPKPLKTSPVSDPAVATTIENGEIIVITKSGRRIPGKEYQKEYSLLKPKEKAGVAYDERTLNLIEDENPLDEDQLFMMGLLPLGALGISPIVLPGDQPDSLQTTRRSAGENVLRSLTETYGIAGELGGIWSQKGSEAIQRFEERDADYRRAWEEGTMPAYRRYLPIDFGMTLLDALGTGLYPLAYPAQAYWGEKAGIGAMEGIRKETRASEALGIENPLAALGADIALDPVNLVFLPGLTKKAVLKAPEVLTATKLWGAEGFGGVRALSDDLPIGLQVKFDKRFWADESATLGGAPMKKLMAEYDARPFSKFEKARLDELSARPYAGLSWAEKSELDDLAFQEWSKSIGPPIEPSPLTQEDWLNTDRFNTEIQRAMNAKYYTEKPIATIDKMPVVPISAVEQEESLRKLEAYRRSRVAPMEEPVPTKVVTAFPKRKAPAISTAVGTDETEAMTREVIARRESRGEATTPEDIKRIRESVLNNAKDSIEYQVRKADEKRFPWGTLALGTGIGAAATASLFGLPPEEQEAGREQVREALKPSEEQGVLGTFVDAVSMDSYLEGAAIMNARAVLTGDTRRYGWKDRITPSIALGIQDKETSLFSWRGAAGTALDIAVAPTTYLSFGSGAAVKIGSVGGKGAKALKLSNKGVKELKTFTKKYGDEMGTLEFVHHIEQSPQFARKVLAAGGVNLRGWGQQVNLIPGSTFDPLTNAAREGAMQFSLEHPAAFKKVIGAQEYLENKFVVRAAIKRLQRSSRLLPLEADYADKAMLLPKNIRFDIAQGTERDIELARKARKAFGENYEDIVSNLIEAPVTRESAKLTKEQRAIVEELEAYNKGFAAAEKELRLLDTEISGYLRHTLTPKTKKYLEKGGKKVSTELYTPLSVENKFGAKRTIQGTVAEINERARKELGIDFDYFEASPFKATSVRRAESVEAVEQAKFLRWTVEKYGVSEETARAAPGEYVQSSSKYIKGAWLPKPIAEDIEKEFVQRDAGAALELYDKALNVWKYSATVTHPAYHATNVMGGTFNNWLAEIDPRSYYRSSRILLGGDKEKVFTTALGDQYTGQELMKMAGESGILSQPGMMDIQKLSYEIADTQTEKSIELAKKMANAPITTAQYEENFIRFSLFNDRIMKGDTVQGAREWVSEFQFQYSKESFTPFERDYMKRAVPFYAWMRGNVPLMGKQLVKSPGKFAQFGKVTDAAVGGQELPQYTEGALTWMWPEDKDTGTFNYMRTPATDLDAINDPLWYFFGATTPFAKYPLEKGLGFNTYTGKDFDPDKPWYDPQSSAESSLIMGRTGRDIGTLTDVYEDRNAGKQVVKYLTGAGQAKTKTKKKLEEQFKEATRRRNDFTWQQRYEGWKRDEMASPLSGIPWQLQGGHVKAVAEGGLPTMENFLTMTAEENAEQTTSQLFRLGLPEKEFKQGKFWEEMKDKEQTRLQERTGEVTEKLEKQGKWVNAAVKEKIEYDARKAINIQLYNRELAKIRMHLDWATRRLRKEHRSLAEKQKIPGFAGDKWSERQIKALEWFIPKYQAQYEAIEALREQERAKEFDLPEQIIRGEEYSKAMLGKEREVVIRGKGPALANPDQIKNMVKYEEIALDRAVIMGDLAVMDLPEYVPKHIRDQVKKPEGQEWDSLQERGRWYAREIWGDEGESWGDEGESHEIPPEPVITPRATAAMNITPTPRPGKPLQTPVQPEVRAVRTPRWNVTEAPSFEEAYGMLLPPEMADTGMVSDMPGKEMARSDFLESDEFITAVQSVVTDYLDRGIER